MRLKHLAATAVLAMAVLAMALIAGASPALAGAAAVNVTPNPSTPGTPTLFSISCGTSATSATLLGATLGLPDRIAMQPVTGPGDFALRVTLPATTSPGLYTPQIDCSNGVSATATLTVGTAPVQAPQTGDGATSTAANSPLTVAGASLLGLAAMLGGFLFYWRRLGQHR